MPRSERDYLVRLVRSEGVGDRVTEAFAELDRADFVPEGAPAYGDAPIAIPHGQTTSQPSLIARMVDAASVGRQDRVLEIGSGYGFQTALLARLASDVTSIDRYPGLVRAAKANLARAGVSNVDVRVGDGFEGCPDKAPFDAIVVSAAAPGVPQPLVEQLNDGGRLVIPVRGPSGDDVRLYVKKGVELQELELVSPARFVPLVPGTES